MTLDGATLLAVALAYGVGSIPFGLLLGKLAGIGDVRAVGSGNIGATNMLRAGGRKLAALTLLLDMGKGLAAVALARVFAPEAAEFAALAALAGHCFPLWLRFAGGKGVATLIGVLLALTPAVGAAFIALWIAVFLAFRYSSLAAITAAALTPTVCWMLEGGRAALAAMPLAALVLLRHRGNMRRLLAGAEPKFSLRAP
jgi:glycerol-3-phosphate acyltransferase PlsY